jgi:hypothetical protein
VFGSSPSGRRGIDACVVFGACGVDQCQVHSAPLQQRRQLLQRVKVAGVPAGEGCHARVLSGATASDDQDLRLDACAVIAPAKVECIDLLTGTCVVAIDEHQASRRADVVTALAAIIAGAHLDLANEAGCYFSQPGSDPTTSGRGNQHVLASSSRNPDSSREHTRFSSASCWNQRLADPAPRGRTDLPGML